MYGLSLVAALLGGMVLGIFFFGGLWLTIRQMEHVPRPGALLFSSFIMRIMLTLGGLYILAWGRWERMVVAAIGLLLSRLVIVNLLGNRVLAQQEVTARGIES